jgi:hypothetical protein
MNAIDELVRDFAPVPEDDAQERLAGGVARAKLRRAMADEQRPRPRRRWVGLRLPIAVAGGLAAMILAVVALLPSHEANAPAPASAAVVLERVAHVATHQPADAYPGPHQYLYLKFREGWTQVANSTIAYRTTDTQQDWVAPNGSGRQRYVSDGSPRFLTPRDRAAWLAAGRPPLTAPSIDATYPAGGDPAGNQVDPRGLPTDPGALRRAIVARFERGSLNVERTFELAGTLLQDSGSPVLRAAVYRMVAELPGVRLLGERTDELGRRGTAVALQVASGVRTELLFDPTTSDVLEESVVQVTPGRALHLPAGTVLHYVAYQGRGVVDSIEALPEGGRVPFHAG